VHAASPAIVSIAPNNQWITPLLKLKININNKEMSGYNVFSNLAERTAYPVETKWINTDPSGQFTIIDNELVLENVGVTVLNDQLLTVDFAGLVSKLDTAVILPNQDLNTTDSPEFVGLTLTGIPNDDTEDKLIVIDAITDQLEYRNKSSLHDQNLDTTGTPSWQSAGIKGTEFVLSTFDDSFTRFHQAPAVTNNDKLFEFQSDTDTGAVRLDVNNNGNKSAGIKLTTKNTGTGNNFIQWENGGNRWFSGVNKANNEFAVHYSPGDPTDNLFNGANERLSLSNTGDLTTLGDINSDSLILQTVPNDNTETKLLVWNSTGKDVEYRDVTSLPIVNPFDQSLNQADPVDFLSVDINNNTLINSNTDSLSSFTQTPAITTGYKQFAFLSDTSDSPVVVEVINADLTATAHTGILLHNPSVGGGNQLAIYETPTENQWTVGRQRTSDTFRWNNSAAGSGDFLTVDANTKMSLSNAGVLGLNGDNLVINPSSDSVTLFEQTPAVTTGQKQFLFQSNTSDNLAGFFVENMNPTATAHVGMYFRADKLGCTGLGGNQCVIFESCGLSNWSVGHQKSTNTYRWNYSTIASAYLTNDAKTQMKLSSTGDLALEGTTTIGGDYITAAAGQLQIQDVGQMQQNFIFDAETIPSTQVRVASHTDQSLSFNSGLNGGLWKSASADGNALINHTTGGVMTFYTNASTVTGGTIPWVSSLRITPTVVNSLLPIQKQDNVVQHSAIGPSLFTITLTATQYDWKSTNGALLMYKSGPNFAINAATGEATLSGWIAASCHAKVSMSCGLRLKAGTNETFIIRCVGNPVAGVPSSQFGAIEITLKNATDFQTISFESLVVVANTGYYKFTIENITGTNNIDISYARAVLVL